MADVAQRRIIQLVVDNRELEKNTKKTADELEKVNSSVSKMGRSLNTLKVAFATVFAVDKIIGFGETLIDSAVQLEKLKASLVAVTGSQRNANAIFKELQDAASVLPATFNDLTESYIRLSRFGITPTIQTLSDYANFAAGLGKDVKNFTEAVIDATTGEYERLKEYGIRIKTVGDELSVSFAGQTETIKKSSDALQDWILKVTRDFTPAVMPLNVALSNLQDAWDRLKFTVVEGGLIEELERTATIMQKMTSGANPAAKQIGEDLAGLLHSLNNFLAEWNQNGDAVIVMLDKIEDKFTNTTIGAVLGAIVAGKLGALIGGAIGATMKSGQEVIDQLDIANLPAWEAQLVELQKQLEAIDASYLDIQTKEQMRAKVLAQILELEKNIDRAKKAQERAQGQQPSQQFPLTPLPPTQEGKSQAEEAARKAAEAMSDDMQKRLAEVVPEPRPSPAELAYEAAEKAKKEAKKPLTGMAGRLQDITLEPRPADLERLTEAYNGLTDSFEGYYSALKASVPENEANKKTLAELDKTIEALKNKGNPFANMAPDDPKAAEYIEQINAAAEKLKAEGNPYADFIAGQKELDFTAPTVEQAKTNIEQLTEVLKVLKEEGNPLAPILENLIKLNEVASSVDTLTESIKGLHEAADELSKSGNSFAPLLEGLDKMSQGFAMLQSGAKDSTEAYMKMGEGIVGVLSYIGDTAASLGIENATFQKAIAMAQATMNGALAVIKVLAEVPPPANFALAGVIAGIVGAQLAVIANQSIPEKKQFGGSVRGGQLYQVGEAGPEMFTDRYGKNYMIPGGAGKVTPNQGNKITINNFAKAKVETEETADGGIILKIIDESVKASRNSIMNDLKNGGNDLANVFQRTYGLRRSL